MNYGIWKISPELIQVIAPKFIIWNEKNVLFFFQLLLRFLKKVVDYKNENKMSLSNVAMIMAPNLFLPSSSKKLKNFKDWEVSIAVPANIVKLMVKYIDILWMVSWIIVNVMVETRWRQVVLDSLLSIIRKYYLGVGISWDQAYIYF